MFEGDELAAAMGVPFFYGLVEAVLLGFYCVIAWKIGWTKAPKNISIWTALSTSYEIVTQEEKGKDAAPGIVADQELSSNTLPTNTEDEEDDDDGFHYVQHSDAEPPSDEEAPKERTEEAKAPPDTTTTQAEEPLLVSKSLMVGQMDA